MELHYSKCGNEGSCEYPFQGGNSGSTLQQIVGKDTGCAITSRISADTHINRGIVVISGLCGFLRISGIQVRGLEDQ